MSLDLLDRLMAALHRNPELEFQLWLTMQKVHFYGPWKTEDDGWVVEDIRGNIVGFVHEEPGGYAWSILECGSVRGYGGSLDDGKLRAERALAGEGWRRAPEELWDPEPQPQAKPSLLTPWANDQGNEWVRYHRPSNMVKARVFLDGTTWKGEIRQPNEPSTFYTPPATPSWNTVSHARYGVDRILYTNGHITLNEMELDPEIPF